MRRTEKEIKDLSIIRQIFEDSVVCRIALIDEDEPYIVPLNYGYQENFLYFHSAPTGRKMELLKKATRVCFEIEYSSEVVNDEVPCKWTSKYRSVIGWGRMETIRDPVAMKQGMDVIMRKYGATGPLQYNEKLMNRMVMRFLTPTYGIGSSNAVRRGDFWLSFRVRLSV